MIHIKKSLRKNNLLKRNTQDHGKNQDQDEKANKS